MYRLGIASTPDVMDDLLTVAKEYDHVINYYPFVYSQTAEVLDIVKEHDHKVDFWLFVGKHPLMLVQSSRITDKELFYLSKSAASFYRSFIQLSANQGRVVQKVSCDSIYPTTQEFFQELNIEIQTYTYVSQSMDTEKRFEFHYNLWKDNKTDGALTSFINTQKELEKEGVPVCHIAPTKAEMRQALNVIVEKTQMKQMQNCVLMINIENFNPDNMKTIYLFEYLQVEVKKTLLKLCELLNGSLIDIGNGKYKIFTTRGSFESNASELQKALDQLHEITELRASAGVGFGISVYSAEDRAKSAIQLADEKKKTYVIVMEDGPANQSSQVAPFDYDLSEARQKEAKKKPLFVEKFLRLFRNNGE